MHSSARPDRHSPGRSLAKRLILWLAKFAFIHFLPSRFERKCIVCKIWSSSDAYPPSRPSQSVPEEHTNGSSMLPFENSNLSSAIIALDSAASFAQFESRDSIVSPSPPIHPRFLFNIKMQKRSFAVGLSCRSHVLPSLFEK